jgi:hypothetical protein
MENEKYKEKCILCSNRPSVYCETCFFFFCVNHDEQHHSNTTHIRKAFSPEIPTEYSAVDLDEIKHSLLPTSYITLRKPKCDKLFDLLQIYPRLLIKSPPGSGKTVLARLFEYYLKKLKNNKNTTFIVPYNVNGNIIDGIMNEVDFINLSKYDSDNTFYFIIDEAQVLFNYTDFWQNVKIITESQKNVKFIFFTNFTYSNKMNTAHNLTP